MKLAHTNKLKNKNKQMTIYNGDEPIPGYDPEDEETTAFPKQVKVLRPKKYKTKTTPKRKSKIKRTIVKTLIILVLIIGAVGYGTYKVNEWFNTHTIKWQSPIQTPVWIESRSVSELQAGHEVIQEAKAINFDGANFIRKDRADVGTTGTSESKILGRHDIQLIVSRVYRLESSGGKNDSCRAKGTYNGYGFAPGTCYKTHEIVEAKVTDWFNTKLQTLDLPTALCYYNIGYKVSDCTYYQNYLKLQ